MNPKNFKDSDSSPSPSLSYGNNALEKFLKINSIIFLKQSFSYSYKFLRIKLKRLNCGF